MAADTLCILKNLIIAMMHCGYKNSLDVHLLQMPQSQTHTDWTLCDALWIEPLPDH